MNLTPLKIKLWIGGKQHCNDILLPICEHVHYHTISVIMSIGLAIRNPLIDHFQATLRKKNQ